MTLRRSAPTVLMVLCCAGPALIAAATLAAIGAITGSRWAIGAAAMLVLAAVALTTKRARFRDAVAALGQDPPPTGRPIADSAAAAASAPEVRRCAPDEAGTAAALLHAFNTEFDTPVPEVAVLTGYLGALLPRDDIEVLLGGEPAVAIAVTTFRPSVWSAGPAALLEELYVRPHLRGHGIGGALLEHALDSARSRGVEWFEINVDEADLDAHRFYLAHGFSMLDPDSGERAFYLSRRL